jgi:hypothetical protein
LAGQPRDSWRNVAPGVCLNYAMHADAAEQVGGLLAL